MGFGTQLEREVFCRTERVKTLDRLVILQIPTLGNLLKVNRGRMLESDEGLEFPMKLRRDIYKINEWCYECLFKVRDHLFVCLIPWKGGNGLLVQILNLEQ